MIFDFYSAIGQLMVYVEELGYDPDEWEECPEPQHFLAFTFFTRILLTIITISIVAPLFWFLKQSKNKKEQELDSELVIKLN